MPRDSKQPQIIIIIAIIAIIVSRVHTCRCVAIIWHLQRVLLVSLLGVDVWSRSVCRSERCVDVGLARTIWWPNQRRAPPPPPPPGPKGQQLIGRLCRTDRLRPQIVIRNHQACVLCVALGKMKGSDRKVGLIVFKSKVDNMRVTRETL